jgi:hypothetical protein
MHRPDGYYWVRYSDYGPLVAKWDGYVKGWYTCGDSDSEAEGVYEVLAPCKLPSSGPEVLGK